MIGVNHLCVGGGGGQHTTWFPAVVRIVGALIVDSL